MWKIDGAHISKCPGNRRNDGYPERTRKLAETRITNVDQHVRQSVWHRASGHAHRSIPARLLLAFHRGEKFVPEAPAGAGSVATTRHRWNLGLRS
ncbi:hypothetical protein Y032_0079g1272 [Ancylostoma ceylanicum]|uniref:Uncharacterized protein n=1 Tax=Ancylostoma ceylanicum TaxID=53326 RepID=A0A016TSE1_9BILA|nr:hypothetical protein Y032_0079g1272 [Ancylostoma ceylanicum]